MPIYGQEALNICHPYMTDIQRYTKLTIFESALQIFFSRLVQAAILKSDVVLAVFSGNFITVKEIFHD